MKFELTPELLLGIDELDKEHKQFFDYVNAALAALEAPEDEAIITAKNIIKKLKDYADFHFKHEEDYMAKRHDAELVLQIHEHQKFREKVEELTAKQELTKEDLGEIVKFMARWLYSHIVTSDTMIGKERHSGKFKLTKEFITGIEIVDTEHAKLFEIIGKAFDILHDDMAFDKFDKISEVLAELRDYTAKHFSDEETYMESIKYDGLDAQKAVHEAFIDKVVHIDLNDLADLDENQDEYLIELLDFLNDWLINHILRMDKKIPVVDNDKAHS